MRIVLKAILILYYSFNVFLISTSTAFTYSASSSNNSENGFYFRSAKKISGASSYDSKPSIPTSWHTSSSNSGSRNYQSSSVSKASSSDDIDDEEQLEPGKMRISEIKAELDLREVSYKDCFDKESLIERLEEARVTGKANPKILEKFNKQKLEEIFDPNKKVVVNDEDIVNAVANDGKLPGGLSPEQFKKLSGNPEVMSLLQDTKMQEAMTLMMTGGREELEKKLQKDPELQETLTKLDSVMKALMS